MHPGSEERVCSLAEITQSDLLQILHFTFQCLYTEDVLDGLSDTHFPVGRISPCHLEHVNKMSEKQESLIDIHKNRLQSILTSYNLIERY